MLDGCFRKLEIKCNQNYKSQMRACHTCFSCRGTSADKSADSGHLIAALKRCATQKQDRKAGPKGSPPTVSCY